MQTDPTNFESVCSLLGIKEDEPTEEDLFSAEKMAKQQEDEYARSRGVPTDT